MPGQPSYGEVAYHAFCRLSPEGSSDFEALSEEKQFAWHNTAAILIAEFHKRQLALSRQSVPSWLALARAKYKEAEELCDFFYEYHGFFAEKFKDFIDQSQPPWTHQYSCSPSGPTPPSSSLEPSPQHQPQSQSPSGQPSTDTPPPPPAL